ncbi:uncharacterized protein BDZ99DRAFT_373911, partial [Mytilinidion resinicola]
KGEGDHEVVWYEGACYGLAVRESETHPVEHERGLQVEARAIVWFNKCFAKAK